VRFATMRTRVPRWDSPFDFSAEDIRKPSRSLDAPVAVQVG
jgi:hypothetical protein